MRTPTVKNEPDGAWGRCVLTASPIEGCVKREATYLSAGGWVNLTEAASFIEFLTERNSLNLWMTQGAVVVLEKALAAGASQEVVRNAVERLVALSCPTAPGLVERLSRAS